MTDVDVKALKRLIRSLKDERDSARESIARLNRRCQIAESAINELANGTGKGKAKSVTAEIWARCNRSHEEAFHEIRERRELSSERDELRATVARVEALADWHDTVAWLDGINSMDASRTHRDAAARLRKALAGDQP